MMNNKLTIYCCYHNKQQIKDFNLKETDNFKLFYGPDGLLNPYINEQSMFYWIWKNDKDSDFIGTCHYRRIIRPELFNYRLVNDTHCQVYNKFRNNRYYSLKEFITKSCLSEQMYKDYEDYVIKKYGRNNKYLKTDLALSNNKFSYMIQHNSFIMSRKHFMDMCDYLFSFLDYINKKYNLQYDDEKYEIFINGWYSNSNIYSDCLRKGKMRYIGYIMEWMVSLYIQTNIENLTELVCNYPKTAFCVLTDIMTDSLEQRIRQLKTQVIDADVYVYEKSFINFYKEHQEYDYYYFMQNDVAYFGNYNELINEYAYNKSDMIIQNDSNYYNNPINRENNFYLCNGMNNKEMHIYDKTFKDYPYKRFFLFFRASNNFLKSYYELVKTKQICGDIEWSFVSLLLYKNMPYDFFRENMYIFFNDNHIDDNFYKNNCTLNIDSLYDTSNFFVYHRNLLYYDIDNLQKDYDDKEIAIITYVKHNNKDLKDWIDYHLNLGIDKFFILYTNSEYVLTDYSNDNVIFILTNINYPIDYTYNRVLDIIKNNYTDVLYTYLIDTNDYIRINEKYTNIKLILKEYVNTNEDCFYVWMSYSSDNDIVYHTNKSCLSLYTDLIPIDVYEDLRFLKAIINMLNYRNKYMLLHDLNNNITGYKHNRRLYAINYKLMYLQTILTKCLEDWILMCSENFQDYKGHVFCDFFNSECNNKITTEKIDAIPKLMYKYNMKYRPNIYDKDYTFVNTYLNDNDIRKMTTVYCYCNNETDIDTISNLPLKIFYHLQNDIMSIYSMFDEICNYNKTEYIGICISNEPLDLNSMNLSILNDNNCYVEYSDYSLKDVITDSKLLHRFLNFGYSLEHEINEIELNRKLPKSFIMKRDVFENMCNFIHYYFVLNSFISKCKCNDKEMMLLYLSLCTDFLTNNIKIK